MAKRGSTAKPARVNIQIKDYLPVGEQPELPFKMVALGDYTLRPDDTEVEGRERVRVDKDTFDDVMKKFNLSLDFAVKNQMAAGEQDVPVRLRFGSLKDFRPEAVVKQVPQLQKMLALRNAVKALRAGVGMPRFVKELMAILEDEDLVQKIVARVSPNQEQSAPPSKES